MVDVSRCADTLFWARRALVRAQVRLVLDCPMVAEIKDIQKAIELIDTCLLDIHADAIKKAPIVEHPKIG